jgi:hypothetical protein
MDMDMDMDRDLDRYMGGDTDTDTDTETDTDWTWTGTWTGTLIRKLIALSLQNLDVNQNNRFIASKLIVLMYDRFIA